MAKRVFLWLIRGYQKYISPGLSPRCRFTPTCSQYAYEAIETRGALVGLGLAVWRLLRCNPLNRRFGYDPVPVKKSRR